MENSITERNKTPDKVFYKSSGGREQIRVSTPIELTTGLNLVTLVAKDQNGLEQRQSLTVRRK